jgi:hypothetical protein
MSRVVLPAPPGGYDPQDQRETRRLLADALARTTADTEALAKRRGTEAVTVPTTGTWRQGDIVWHKAPVAGGHVGWVCVVAGSPGVWRTFGAIAP